MARIWLDAGAPREARYFSVIAELARERGHEVLLTAKDHAETVGLLRRLGADFVPVGKHGGGTKLGKLISYAERAASLASVVSKFDPDVLVSLSVPEAVRVAFGLGKRIISIDDAPHAYHVGKLSLPLSDAVVFPAAIPPELFLRLGAPREALHPFDGIDEVAWIRRFSPDERVLDELGLERGDLIVVARPEESKAAYLMDRGDLGVVLPVVRLALEEGARVVFFPRYPDQRRAVQEFSGGSVVIPDRPVDTLSLYHFSSMVVTGGATMAREAAMLGVPSLVMFPLEVPLHIEKYLGRLGLPIRRVGGVEEALGLARSILRDPESHRVDPRPIVSAMEDPAELILSIIDGWSS